MHFSVVVFAEMELKTPRIGRGRGDGLAANLGGVVKKYILQLMFVWAGNLLQYHLRLETCLTRYKQIKSFF